MEAILANAPRAAFPKTVSPMLATLVDKPFDDEGWIYDPDKDAKFDVEIVPQGDKLKIVGYAGVKLFSQTFTWTKAPGDLQRCQS